MLRSFRSVLLELVDLSSRFTAFAFSESARHRGNTNLSVHLIRLRGGWDCRSAAAGGSLPQRFALPTDWGMNATGLITLSRPFGRPPLDAAREALSLRLDQVPGLLAMRLNGQPIIQTPPVASNLEVPLANLRDRNVLELEVDLAEAVARLAPEGADWGVIALAIRSVDGQG